MEVNVEAIMNEIRTEIKEKGYTSDMLSFADVTGLPSSYSDTPSEDLRGAVIFINESHEISESVPVSGNVIVRFIKKIIRKLLRFYVKPIVMSHNEYNALCARAFTDINDYINEEAKKRAAAFEGRIAALEERLNAAEKENERLSCRIAELEGKQ